MAAVNAEHLHSPILVSACLLGEPCRYDGKSAPCKAVQELGCTYALLPVCPEQLGGLPTPRTPSEIGRDGRVYDRNGMDRTAAFEQGAAEAVQRALENGCRVAILKSNSPSCGCHHVYDGSFSGTLVEGKGIAATALERAGIDVFDEHDLEDALNERDSVNPLKHCVRTEEAGHEHA